jgi:hypothetical protein
MRERQVASFLGLPCRIREADCDIEPPRASDFEGNEPAPEDSVFARELPEHAAYFIAVVEVAKTRARTRPFAHHVFFVTNFD